MVKHILFAKARRLVICLLLSVFFIAEIYAQGYQPRRQSTYSSRSMRSYSSSEANAIARDVYNVLYKKKDKDNTNDKDKVKEKKKNKNKSSNEDSSSQYRKDENTLIEESTKQISSSTSDNKSADDVELVVAGEGPTKDEATKAALRGAIEQAFGTFVSSNTKILNDELVKDEIVTVSSGNIKNYTILSDCELDGTWSVTIQTTVSVGKLIKYVQSKGAEAELAGATFAMNVKMKELYKYNQYTALVNLRKQLKPLISTSFDFELNISEPTGGTYGGYDIPVFITVKANKNAEACYQLYHNTLSALSVPKEEGRLIKNGGKEYYLRNTPSWAETIEDLAVRSYEREILECICNFTISDGYFEYVGSYRGEGTVKLSRPRREEDRDFIRKQFGPSTVRFQVESRSDDPFLPILANPNYAGNIIATFNFELGPYTLDELSKISSFKIRPTNTKE